MTIALVRSWASDVVGLFDPDYVWHDMARVWQTPGDGEQWLDTMFGGTVGDRTEQMASLGIPGNIAESIAAAQGPGLSLLATQDPYVGSVEIRQRAAERAGARTEVLDGPDTGGWCKIRLAAPRPSPTSGRHSART